jgi:CTP:molybdopterin cytidylyltransferase MocA
VSTGLPIATLVLAAGCSSRLGRPKQLLPYAGVTLLRHAALTALEAALGPVIVVLGCHEAECRECLAGLPVRVLSNPRFPEGMGSSLACGMQAVNEAEQRAVLVTLCDQPCVTSGDLRALAARLADGTIAASSYHDVVGPPALFAATHFARLRALHGTQGARALFRDQADLIKVPCERAAFDVDVESDVRSSAFTRSGTA